MSYEFIREEINEAKLFRRKSDLEMSRQSDLADGLFALALSLQIMRFEDPTKAQRYAKKTLSQGLDGWRTGGTDMNNLAQVFLQPTSYRDRINQDRPYAAIPKLTFLSWLRDIAYGRVDATRDRRFLMGLERQLLVRDANLKNARLLAGDWQRALPRERSAAVEKVYQVLNRTLNNSDLFGGFTKTKAKSFVNQQTAPVKKSGVPFWVAAAAAGAGLYALGRKLKQ